MTNSRKILLAASCIVVAGLISSVTTAGDPVTDAIAHAGRSDADRERDARSRPDATLALLAAGAGDRVIDLFAGGGYYSELLAHIVGSEGEVVAYNNDPYMQFAGKEIKQRLDAGRLPQVSLYTAPVAEFTADEGSFDSALMVLSYHDLYWSSEQYNWPVMDSDAFLSKVSAALKPGGRVLVVDHSAAPGTGSSAVADFHRIEERFVVAHFLQHGLVKIDSSDALRNREDTRTINMGDPSIRGKTDRFVLLFEKR